MNYLTKIPFKSLLQPSLQKSLTKRLFFAPAYYSTTQLKVIKPFQQNFKEKPEKPRIFTKPKAQPKDETPLYIPKFLPTHQEATLPLVQDVITMLDSLKTEKNAQNEILRSIEKKLVEIFNINPFHCHRAIQNSEAAFLHSLKGILEGSKPNKKVMDILVMLDKYRILDIPSVRSKVQVFVPSFYSKTFPEFLLKVRLGYRVEKQEMIDLFVKQREVIQKDERILVYVFDGLMKAFGEDFAKFCSDLFHALDSQLSVEEVDRLKKVKAENEVSFGSVKDFQKDCEVLLKALKNSKKSQDDYFQRRAEDLLIHYILNYRNYKEATSFRIEPLFSVAEQYLKAAQNSTQGEEMYAIYLIKSLLEISKEGVTLPVKDYSIPKVNNWTLQVYAFENFQTRINRILEKNSKGQEEGEVKKEVRMNSYEQNLIAYLKDSLVTPQYMKILLSYLWALAQNNFGSKEFFSQLESILDKKIPVQNYPTEMIQIATSFARKKLGRNLIKKILSTLTEKVHVLDTANKINLLFVMAHSNIVYRSLYSNMESGFREYTADPTKTVDDMVLLIYCLSKCGESADNVNGVNLAFKKIESAQFGEIHDSKLVPFIWSCITHRRYSEHFKSAVKKIIGKIDVWRDDAMSHFAQCYFALKETEPQVFEELNLAQEEKRLVGQLILNGVKIHGSNNFPGKFVNYNEAQILQIMKQEYPSMVEDAWMDGFYFDMYIPEKKLYVDFENDYFTQQDSDTLLGPEKMKQQVMKSKVEKGGLRYEILDGETQRAIARKDVDLFEKLGLVEVAKE